MFFMKKVFSILIPCFFVLTACDSGTATETTSSNTNTTATMPRGQEAVQDNDSERNVVQVAVGSTDHTTLVKAVQAADLVTDLSNAGPFTVFAPTNAAFDALPKGTVEDLVKPENKAKLQDILQYHVAVGVYNTNLLQDGQNLGVANGGNLKISKKDGKIFVNDAEIIGTVKAANGVVHVINKVLLPQ